MSHVRHVLHNVTCRSRVTKYTNITGAIAPLYIGMAWVGQYRSHTFHVSVAIGTQSGSCLHKRVPMVKIWGSSKNDQNRITEKLLKLEKFIFTILHLVVVLLLQFQLTYLKTCTELRNETLYTDRTP